jgi:hypothetical protein
LALELNVTLLGDRRLFDGNHLPLHLCELGRRLLIAADKECRRPEDDDRGRGSNAVIGALLILRPYNVAALVEIA